VVRPATIFSCGTCGATSPKWHGRCPGCGEWNTIAEEPRAAPARGRPRQAGRALRPVPLGQVEAPAVERLRTGIGELDRVLGGGLVPGSLVLIGGSPGIGKSTLTTAALAGVAAGGAKVLYVSG
jgi:DNA repair protein RadA/Sms